MIDAGTIAGIEARAAAAWPAARTIEIGDWLVRLSDGYTRRANATSAIRVGAALDTVLPAIEAAYAAHGRAAQFRLTSLAVAGCDALLAEAGYAMADPTGVMIAAVPAAAADPRVAIAATPSAAWRNLSDGIEGRAPAARAGHAALLARIDRPTGYATLHEDGIAVGIGLGVADTGMTGLFDLAVVPEYRGRGIGRSLVAALCHWGAAQAAPIAWLQVADANIAARALYRAAGFVPAYSYHYRVAPSAAPGV